MLYVIGLGLSDEKDITVKGLEAVKGSKRVYLEAYTSILMIPKEKLEQFYGREVILATRELVELEADSILADAGTIDVSFLVVGDPTAATTHTDLLLRAQSKGIPCQVIHNASIMTALGSTGLQLYNFGQTLSLPFYTESWRPGSWYDRLEENLKLGMHTCVLLDIKVREQSEEDMIKGIMRYGPPRFMNPATAIEQILYTENERHPASSSKSKGATTDDDDDDEAATSTTSRASSPDPTMVQYPVYPTLLDPHKTLIMTLSRLGTPTQQIMSGTLEEMASLTEEEFGGPLHSVVIVGGNSVRGKGRLHPLEAEYAAKFAVGGGKEFWRCAKEDYGVERESV